ncbi:MAG: hypothetical protein JNL28_00820 [Planctomycetes bacterium]|nr:hypothetical protein [Planctomycetota bacterium]
MCAALVRTLVIWMPSDQMLENRGLPFEEVLRGNATFDLLRGTLLPFVEYQTNHFSGGSLVVSVLALPLFAVFGPVFPVLRMTSLCFSLPLICLTFALVDRRYSRRAAWISALALAFAPPGYQFLNCTVYGTHMEGNLVTLVLVFLFLRRREGAGAGFGPTLVLGLLSGFALWFGYGQTVILTVLIALEFAARGWRAWRPSLAPFVLGFLVGLSPWITYMIRHPDSAFRIYRRSMFDHVAGGGLQVHSFARFFTYDGAHALWLHGADEQVGSVLAHLIFWTLVAVVLASAWQERAGLVAFVRALCGKRAGFRVSLRLIALLFVGVWTSALILSDFKTDHDLWVQGYRYLMPLWPFLAILTGIWIHELRAPFARRAALAGVCCVLAIHLGATLLQLRPDRFESHADAPAVSRIWHVRMIVLRMGDEPEEMLAIVRRIAARRSDPERTELIERIAAGLAQVARHSIRDPASSEHDGVAFSHTLQLLSSEGPEPFRPTFAERLSELRAALRPK